MQLKKKPSQNHVQDKLPVSMEKPRPSSAGSFKLICLAFLSLAILGGAAFWLTRDDAWKEDFRGKAADLVNRAAAGTPLAGIGDSLQGAPPPPPPQVINPPTEQGTLAGRSVAGTIASPLVLGNSSETNTGSGHYQQAHAAPGQPGSYTPDASGKPVFSPNVLPPAKEDVRVPTTYLSEIAQWLATRYKAGTGTLTISPQGMNQLLGVTIAGQSRGGRDGLLRYAFQPSMLTGLYKLYIDQFMQDLDSASRKRGFSAEQNRHFHESLAGSSALMAGALESIAQTPDLGARLEKIEALGQKAVEINTQLASAVLELDELRAKKASSQQISTVQMRVDGITARYRRAMEEQTAARSALAKDFKKRLGQPMDDDSLLFLAAWVERRLTAGGSARESINSCVSLLRDLSRRCGQAASSLPTSTARP